MFGRILVASTLLIACGRDSDPGPGSVADRFPRLSHAQWEATTKDLLGLPAESGLSANFQPDPPTGRFDNNIARLSLGSSLWRDYQRAAEALAERVITDSALLAKIAPNGPSTDPRELIARFGLHAFRRPLKPIEIDRYVQLFDGAAAELPQHDAFTAGVRLVVQAMLQSPYFLYRVELSDRTTIGMQPLDGYEVASRLSYLLWNTMPDDALLAAAGDGKLDDADGVREAAQRMLDDPRAIAQLRHFHEQAYSIDYSELDKSASAFPTWRREVGSMMREETVRFLDDVVAHDGTVADLWTSRKAFVNADLAKLYGISGTFGDEYTAVDLDPTKRAGLLTRLGFLARNATLDTPDSIHRGVFINTKVLCRPIAAPPTRPDNLMRSGTTNRQQVTSITGPGTCGEGCHHTIINPLGFAFENYDAIGEYRTVDNGQPVDSAATYTLVDGRELSFANGVDLSEQLATLSEVHECYAQNLLELVFGRELSSADQKFVRALVRESMTGASIKELVLSVVTSNAFRARVKGAP